MNASRPTRKSCALGAVLAVFVALGLAAAAAPAGAAALATSGNWAGYVAASRGSAGARFSSASGTWRQPAARCTAGRESFAAVWVGLGGYREGARALEQVGTDANCTRSGRPSYGAWFELLPADPVPVGLAVRPGDLLSASVTTRGRSVTLRLRNLTTGARFSTTRRYARPDVSTAEWIVEAPSTCESGGACTTLALANFGTVPFQSATATANGRTGTILDARWSATALELQQGSGAAAGGRPGLSVRARSLTRASPSAVAAPAGAFTVTWSERATGREPSDAPTLPGFGAGSP